MLFQIAFIAAAGVARRFLKSYLVLAEARVVRREGDVAALGQVQGVVQVLLPPRPAGSSLPMAVVWCRHSTAGRLPVAARRDEQLRRHAVALLDGEGDLLADVALVDCSSTDLHVERDAALAPGKRAHDLLEIGPDQAHTDIPVGGRCDRRFRSPRRRGPRGASKWSGSFGATGAIGGWAPPAARKMRATPIERNGCRIRCGVVFVVFMVILFVRPRRVEGAWVEAGTGHEAE